MGHVCTPLLVAVRFSIRGSSFRPGQRDNRDKVSADAGSAVPLARPGVPLGRPVAPIPG
jgi:hypothetical protein